VVSAWERGGDSIDLGEGQRAGWYEPREEAAAGLGEDAAGENEC
jgi:hypothetical protein